MSSTVESPDAIRARTEEMKTSASQQMSFTDAELETAIESLKALAGENSSLDWAALRQLMSQVAHVSHKDWQKTETAAQELEMIMQGPGDTQFEQIMERVLIDGVSLYIYIYI